MHTRLLATLLLVASTLLFAAACGSQKETTSADVQLSRDTDEAVAADSGTETSACAAVLCPPGKYCIVTDGAPSCVPLTRDPCANFECPPGSHCVAPADAPECVPSSR